MRPASRPLTRIAALATGALAVAGLLTAVAPSAGATAVPKAPVRLTSATPIESPTEYVGQVSCDPRVRPGTAKLAKLIVKTYPVQRSWSSAYACGTDSSRSEHYEGRAIDWMTDVHNRKQRAAAQAFIGWLLATDAQGNQYAMARRLGVMYVIWNNRIWGTWGGWEPYNGCAKRTSRADDNACHRTHVHISLSWNGAMGRTSFWTGRVAATDYGPCRSRDMNWAPRYVRANTAGCAQYPKVKAAKGSSVTKRALVRYSGAALHKNSRGPAVSAVQRALHVRTSARYDAKTVSAVKRFQGARHLPRSGRMLTPTWRALLAATK